MSTCDGCGKERSIYRYSADGDDKFGLGFCFLCVKEEERKAAKECGCGWVAKCKDPSICPHNG